MGILCVNTGQMFAEGSAGKSETAYTFASIFTDEKN